MSRLWSSFCRILSYPQAQRHCCLYLEFRGQVYYRFGLWLIPLFSYIFHRDGARWVSQVRDLIEAHEQDTPQFRHMYWRQTFDTPSYQREFNPPEEKTWAYKLQANKEIVVDRASSKSYVAVLLDDKKAEVQEEMRKIVDQGLDRVWIDEAQGLFEYPYKTWVVIAHKK